MLATHTLDADAQLDHLARVNHTSAVEDPARLGHGAGDAHPVDTLLGLVLLGAAHTSSEASILALALLDAVGAVVSAAGLDVESVEGILSANVGSLDKVLVEGEEVVRGGNGVLERSGVGLGVGLAAEHLGGDASGSGRRSGRGRVAELVELGGDDNGGAAVASIVGIAVNHDVVAGDKGAEKLLDLLLDNEGVAAGVEDGNLARSLLEEGLDHLQGGSLTGVGGVLLEGVAKNGNLLANEGVVEALDDTVGESVTSVLVHLDDLSPVLADLRETHGISQVDQVEDILLEAAATETDTSHQELVSDTGIDTDSASDLIDISAGLLANSGDGVDAGNTLSKHGVGNQLGELRRPDIGGQDALPGNPGSVNVDKGLGGLLARGSGSGTDKDSVGVEQIVDGGTGSQELGVGENFEVDARPVHGELIAQVSGVLSRKLNKFRNDPQYQRRAEQFGREQCSSRR